MRLRFASLLVPSFLLFLACGSSSSDGGTSDGDAGGADSGTTTPGKDGSTTGPDGSSGGDASSGPFCASLNPAPSLCADFDQGSTPASSVPQVDQGGSCAIDTTTSLSSPGSYTCTVPAGSGVATALLGIPLPYDAAVKRFVVAFSFRPDTATPATGTLVIARAFVSNTHAISIEPTSENGPVIREQENPPGGLDVPSGNFALPAAGAWTRYELTLDLDAKNATLKANGAQVATMNLTGTSYDRFALNLGIQADAAFTARYDNLAIDLQK